MPLLLKIGGAGPAGATGATGPQGPAGSNGAAGSAGAAGIDSIIWTSDTPGSAYANGVTYTPLPHGSTTSMTARFIARSTGTISLVIRYAMSSSQSADVRLRMDKRVVGVGQTPSTALTTGTAFTVTCANDVLTHDFDSGDSADLAIAVTAGDHVALAFYRIGGDGADTHTGDLQIIDVGTA